MRIQLAVGALEECVRLHAGSAMTRTGNVDNVQIQLFDEPIEMKIDEIQAGRGSPMAEQAWLDVFNFQRLTQKWILEKVYLPNGEVVCGASGCVHPAQLFRGQGVVGIVRDCRPWRSRGSHFCILPLPDRADTCRITPTRDILAHFGQRWVKSREASLSGCGWLIAGFQLNFRRVAFYFNRRTKGF